MHKHAVLRLCAVLLFRPASSGAIGFAAKCAAFGRGHHYRGSCYIPIDITGGGIAPGGGVPAMMAGQRRLCAHMTGYAAADLAVIPDKTVLDSLRAGLPSDQTARYALYRLDWPQYVGKRLTWHWVQSDGRRWPQIYDGRMVTDGFDGSGRNGGIHGTGGVADHPDTWNGYYVCQYRGAMTGVLEGSGALGVETGAQVGYELEERQGVASVGDCATLCHSILLCQAFSYSKQLSACRAHRLLAGDAHMPLTLVANATYDYYRLAALPHA